MKNSFTELKLDELLAKRDELRRKYFDLRFQLVVGHVENPLEKRNLRRHIARVETRITEHKNAGELPGAAVTAVAKAGASRRGSKATIVAKAATNATKATAVSARGAK